MQQDQQLWELCQSQFFPRRLSIRSAKTRRQYDYAIRDFGAYLGRPPTLVDLDDDVVTMWTGRMLDEAEQRGESVNTVREKLGRVLTFWRWAATGKRRLIDYLPTVQRPAAVDPVPIALTEDQATRLFESALREPLNVGDVPGWYWWPALLGFIWMTSERIGAVLQLRWEWLNLERMKVSLPAIVRKGKRKFRVYDIRPSWLPLLDRIRQPQRELVFEFPYSESCFYYRLGRIASRAGLPNDRKHKCHCLRVTHATYLKILGGDPTRQLGHESAATTEESYIDQTFIPSEQPEIYCPWEPRS